MRFGKVCYIAVSIWKWEWNGGPLRAIMSCAYYAREEEEEEEQGPSSPRPVWFDDISTRPNWNMKSGVTGCCRPSLCPPPQGAVIEPPRASPDPSGEEGVSWEAFSSFQSRTEMRDSNCSATTIGDGTGNQKGASG